MASITRSWIMEAWNPGDASEWENISDESSMRDVLSDIGARNGWDREWDERIENDPRSFDIREWGTWDAFLDASARVLWEWIAEERAAATGLYHVSIFVNGCLNDSEAWFDSIAAARLHVDEWRGDDAEGPLHWHEASPLGDPVCTLWKAYFPESPYMAEITHYPDAAWCECCDDGVCEDRFADDDVMCPVCHAIMDRDIEAYEWAQL